MNNVNIEKINISELFPTLEFDVGVSLNYYNKSPIDIACFALNSENKLVDGRYMIFPSHDSSPEGAVKIVPQEGTLDMITFHINLNILPTNFTSLVFIGSVTPFPEENMFTGGYIRLCRNDQELFNFELSQQPFVQMNAFTFSSISFQSGQWQYLADGIGFPSGVMGLFKYYEGIDFLEHFGSSTKFLILREDEARELKEQILRHGLPTTISLGDIESEDIDNRTEINEFVLKLLNRHKNIIMN
ncbi:MAG: TerD family protein [Deltaproteobacteria bacterium]|jgi:tellurite resistance protein TerA|nr:TerD family protein [Deltaproteobacteria bacterium]